MHQYTSRSDADALQKSRRTLKDDTKRALSDFLADLVMHADDVARAGGVTTGQVLGGVR